MAVDTRTVELVDVGEGKEIYEVEVSKSRNGEKLTDTITVEVPAGLEDLTDQQKEEALNTYKKAEIEGKRNYHRENQMILESEKAEKMEKAKEQAKSKLDMLKNAGMSEEDLKDLLSG